MAHLRNQDHVFDSHAASSGNVDSRFNRDHHSSLKAALLPGAQTRWLMYLKPNPMPGRMREGFDQPASPKDASSGFINLLESPSRLNCLDCRGLCLSDGFVHAPRVFTGLPHVHSAGHVRTITAEYNTEVEH